MINQKVKTLEFLKEKKYTLSDEMQGIVVDSIDFINNTALFKNLSFWSSKEWLMSQEQTGENCFLYLCILIEGNVIGMIPSQFIHNTESKLFYNIPLMLANGGNFGEDNYLSEEEKLELSSHQNIIKHNIRTLYPSLVAANPSSYFSLYLDQNLNSNLKNKVLTGLVTLYEMLSLDLKCMSNGFLYIYEESIEKMDELLIERDYIKATLGADCVIDVIWKDFKEYLSEFPKKRRANLRRERSMFNKASIEVEIKKGVNALSNELIELQLSLSEKYGIKNKPIQVKKKFEAIKQYLDEHIVVFIAKKQDEVIGFSLFFEYNDILYSYIAGFDYEKITSEEFCYFNLVIYEPLIWCMNKGIKQIRFGLSSYEAKMRRGSYLKRNAGYFKVQGHCNNEAIRVINLFGFTEERLLNELEDNILVNRIKEGEIDE
ncbi:peptidoglycan biosynthesis/recognition protein [Bacillus sp. AG236]|uniref:peptidogalycan biosysnthesis protein n=1 Tax=Priestia megaterium TaxID=1404 RepID=UPI000DF15ADF|nr:GNAT family N-acetyltransferase [Priestia megaterium]MCM3185916.1 GNAT family N-acetyltransferase [Priestia megaterium]RCX19558.1 peptidoglycan biosynthesis/recognition protein [Bacillus sp. AG236]